MVRFHTPLPNKEITMKSISFKVLRSGEHVICEDVRDVKTIDGVEYLQVRKEGQARTFLMRKDALAKIKVDSKVKML
jgi:hypothetical protein